MTRRRRRGDSFVDEARRAHAGLTQALAAEGAPDPSTQAALLLLHHLEQTSLYQHGLVTSPPGPLSSPERGSGTEPPGDDEGHLADVFEALVNEGQPGAYSTGPDVAAAICRSTILPCLFDRIKEAYPAAFVAGGPVWGLLQRQPDRYLPPEMRHGAALPLPPEIAAGVHAVALRVAWDTPAPSAYALPGETWREAIARRDRYAAAQEQLASGTIADAGELVTLNADTHRLLLDVLEDCDDPALRGACWNTLQTFTILDPACGSGAFLLAALDLLEPLFLACMPGPSVLAARTASIANNLFGVDIMEAAIEVAQMRLRLRLAACCRTADEFAGVAAIPVNLRAGNALVGHGFGDVDRRGAGHWPAGLPDADVELRAGQWPTPLFDWPGTFPEVVARDGFDVVVGNPPFLEVTDQAVPYRTQLAGYRTAVCRNLYPCVVERGHALLRHGGWLGMILPLAAFSTRNMAPFSEAFGAWFPQTWVSFYHFRPAMLFSGEHPANIPTAIAIGRDRPPSVGRRTIPSSAEGVSGAKRLSTGIRKWPVGERASLFRTVTYTQVDELPCPIAPHAYPKLGNPIENALLRTLAAHPPVRRYLGDGDEGNAVYYRTAGGLYWKVIVNFPWPYHTTSNKRQTFQPEVDRDVFVALFNSSLFWWYYTVTFDTLNLKDYTLFGFPFAYPEDSGLVADLKDGAQALMEQYRASAAHLRRGATGSYTIYARHAKPVIDRIDRTLAAHYGLTDAELDFVLSYDLKHRMGSDRS